MIAETINLSTSNLEKLIRVTCFLLATSFVTTTSVARADFYAPRPTTLEAADHAEIIVFAKCIGVRVGVEGGSGMFWTYYTFRNISVAKSILPESEFIVRLIGGQIGGHGSSVHPEPPKFVPGEKVVLFMGDLNIDGYHPITWRHVYRVRTNGENNQQYVQPMPDGLTLRSVSDGRARASLDDFLDTLEQRYSESSP